VVFDAPKYGLAIIPSVYLDNPNANGSKYPASWSEIEQNSTIMGELNDLINVLNDPRTDIADIPFVVIGNEEITQ
jgi:hypothetical protein